MSGHQRPMNGHGSFRALIGLALVACVPLSLVSISCGGGDGALPYAPPTVGGGGSSAWGFDAGSSGVQPVVEIRGPADGALLASASAPEVRARITTAMGFLEPSSIRFVLTRNDASPTTPPVATGTLSGPFGDAQYTGLLNLSGVGGGAYTLTVLAATTGGAAGSAAISVNLDAGPALTIVTPQAGSQHKGSVVVSVVADSGAFEPTMLPLEATIAGRALDLQPTGAPNSYQTVVDFRGYTPPLKGEQLLTVAARNSNGTRTVATTKFTVDESGPLIENTSPAPADVVGRVIEVSARVTDGAGVLDSSVIALIGDQTTPQFKLVLQPRGGGVYSAPFDTAQLTRCGLLSGGLPRPGTYCIVYPTVSFRAADSLGNETSLAYSFGIDNQPPLLDLDPPAIRVARRRGTLQCSWAFDPLGEHTIPGNMPDDNCAVGQLFQLRARAEDDVNGARFLQVAPLATIDPERIDAYILNDTSQPLTVDSDGDGICDEINPKLLPTTSPPTTSRQVLKVRLGAVLPQGAADFTLDQSLAGNPRCSFGDDVDLPPLLCRGEEPTIAISYGPKLPAIWSLEPIEPTGLRCFGNQFDAYANHIGGSTSRGAGAPPPGWACIAVQATDRVGNTGVSAPMRVWIDYDGNQTCPAQGHGPPPDCTGTFNVQTGALDATRCTSRRYTRTDASSIELCLDGNCG